ncbi:MAG: hypothetical protein LQ351_003397 [Letrouitia transgressa]|nr:MAG: hypothetical protein LQ351_003397 [Letrouitia transgressa]
MSSSSSSPPPTSTSPISSTGTSPTRISAFESSIAVGGGLVPRNFRFQDAFCPSGTEYYDDSFHHDPPEPFPIASFEKTVSLARKSIPSSVYCKNSFCPMKGRSHLGGPLCFDTTDPSQKSYPLPPFDYFDQTSKRIYLSKKRNITKAEVEGLKKVTKWTQNFLYVHGKMAASRLEDEKRANNKKDTEKKKSAATARKAIKTPKNSPGDAKKTESTTKPFLQMPHHRPLINHTQLPSFYHVEYAHKGGDPDPPVPSGIKEIRHFTHPIFQRRNSAPPDGPEPRGYLDQVQNGKNNKKSTAAKAPVYRGPRHERKGHVIIGCASLMASKSQSI